MDTYPLKIQPVAQYKDLSKRLESMSLAQENRRMPVIQYDCDGNYIQEFESALAASKALNCPQPCISEACKSKSHISKGFIWKYKTKELSLQQI